MPNVNRATRTLALLFYDQRGAGRSTLVSDSAGLDAQRFADDLEAVRKHFIPPETGREWEKALPNGRFLLLEGSGHFPYLEVPDAFFKALEGFLQGH